MVILGSIVAGAEFINLKGTTARLERKVGAIDRNRPGGSVNRPYLELCRIC